MCNSHDIHSLECDTFALICYLDLISYSDTSFNIWNLWNFTMHSDVGQNNYQLGDWHYSLASTPKGENRCVHQIGGTNNAATTQTRLSLPSSQTKEILQLPKSFSRVSWSSWAAWELQARTSRSISERHSRALLLYALGTEKCLIFFPLWFYNVLNIYVFSPFLHSRVLSSSLPTSYSPNLLFKLMTHSS